ncbi:hypothetical protein [Pantoea sp. CCBC3-3-1]|uniref:hypothetical protein n=1 Tax=Pantoea sp. CCBC3-3-1 TaxID=2490851 RepID=UPI0011BD6FDE|nr:hypothetical protein [Pantoea sp. CCBC3-3-1]
MAAEKTYKGYTLDQVMWWVKRLGQNVALRVEAGEYRLIFSHKTCGTQELYGSFWTCAQNAVEALATAIRRADNADIEAYAAEYPESVSG